MTNLLKLLVLLSVVLFGFSCSNGEESGISDTGNDVSQVDTKAPQFGGISGITLNFPESIKLSWAPAKDDVTPENKIVYLICMSETTGECAKNFSQKHSATGVTNYQITGLTEGKKYFFIIRARDEAGNTDTNTNEKSVIFEKEKDKNPPTFMGLSFASPSGPSSVRLLWDSASDNYTKKEDIVYSVCM
ncbi:MAG: fibronectin type III domain-containing protein, partial [Deltaproteobacteria bacterium]|nr:fibronectin type III domain-containing protein [Deltaproteobacteria bacterium]